MLWPQGGDRYNRRFISSVRSIAMRPVVLFFALLTGCASLVACGQKGPLFIPSDQQQPPAPDPQSQPQPAGEAPVQPSR